MFSKEYKSLQRLKASPNAKRIKLEDSNSSSASVKSSIFSEEKSPSQSSKSRKKRLLENLKNTPKKSSVLEYTPKDLDSEESSDDDLGLVTLPPSILKLQNVNKESKRETEMKDAPVLSPQQSPGPKADVHDENFIKRIRNIRDSTTPKPKIDLVGDILTKKSDPQNVKAKFEHMKIPEVVSDKTVLRKRIKKYLQLVPRFLEGSEEMSFFYDLAQKQKEVGPHETMRQEDKYQIKWDDFVGGYYGIKRQFYISNIITNKYNKEIMKAAKRNTTIAYWGTDDYTKYVLANEIIIRLAMEDFDVTLERARDIIKATSEYGSVVTDLQELHESAESFKQDRKPLKIDDLFR